MKHVVNIHEVKYVKCKEKSMTLFYGIVNIKITNNLYTLGNMALVEKR